MSVTWKSTIPAGFIVFTLTCRSAFGQSNDKSHGTKATNANVGTVTVGQEVTATGCLTKQAKEKSEFLITGEDGRTWGLKSSSVKLADHLNHKVTVTGKVTKAEHESNE